MSEQVFGRDGHLLELAIERFVLDELERADAVELEQHVADCASCRSQVDAIQGDTAALPDLFPSPVAQDAPDAAIEPANDPAGVTIPPWKKIGPAVALLAAALLIGILLPRAGEFQARGGQLELEVYRHDGQSGRVVLDGDVVYPDERLGFRLTSGRGGHAMVVGVDDAGTVYPCWPQPEGVSVLLDPMTEPTTLPTAVRLDDRLGEERIVALACDEPFSFGAVADALAGGGMLDGCESVDVVLQKDAP